MEKCHEMVPQGPQEAYYLYLKNSLLMSALAQKLNNDEY
jgi:hypothetical protein